MNEENAGERGGVEIGIGIRDRDQGFWDEGSEIRDRN